MRSAPVRPTADAGPVRVPPIHMVPFPIMRIYPFLPQDLAQVPELSSTEPAALLALLRWHLRTPYATVLKSMHGEALLTGALALVRHGASARIAALHMHPAFAGDALAEALLLAARAAVQAAPVRYVDDGTHARALVLAGYVPESRYARCAGGSALEQVVQGVAPFCPEHVLALLRLDLKATGEDRREQLLEHLYGAQVHTIGGRAHGYYLPLLGGGYVCATSPAAGQELMCWQLQRTGGVVVPLANKAAMDRLHAWGFSTALELTCWRSGPPATTDEACIWSV
jgi:hypothetical protein